MEDEQAYNRIDQEVIDKLFAEPIDLNDNKNANTLADDGNNYVELVTERKSARPTMTWTKPEQWNYSHKQITHKQTTKPKKVKFYDDEQNKLEMCHNLITQLSPNPKEDMECTPQLVIAIVHDMSDIKNNTMAEGEIFGQQYIL